MDVKNGEPIPRKSILKSRSRENSVCSDTSESSAADFEERRMIARSFSHDDTTTHSDTSDGITEEDSPTMIPLHPTSRFEVRQIVTLVFILVWNVSLDSVHSKISFPPSLGFFGHSHRKGSDAYKCSSFNHCSSSFAHHTGEETGRGGNWRLLICRRYGPSAAAHQKGVKVQSC